MWNRREFGVGVGAAIAATRANAAPDAGAQLTALELSIGGRIGVAALDTGTGRRIAHRADERFAMCSTFKWLLAATFLAESDRGSISLDSRLSYRASDLPAHSPVTEAHLSEGWMSIAKLCEATVEMSDNGAGNLLLRRIGGPAGVTAFARAIGDSVTRLDRFELALNENLPGDPRDTTTPNTTIADFQKVLLGTVLKPASRDLLTGWMKNCRTGLERLRAGLPHNWIVADKTGTGTGSGRTSAANDIAVAWPPGRPPILIASYISGSPKPLAALNASHARVGQIVAAALG